MTNTNNIYYSARLLLSHKALYNLIVGVRGHGKTYDTTKRCIDLGLEQKNISFVVLVRYKEDIVYIKDDWWSVVENLYPDYEFFSKKNIIYAKNNLEIFPIGEFVALKEYSRAKRKPRPYVKYIFFDEFLNEDNDYLSDEINKFLSVCDSIIRNRDDVRVMLVSNHISVLNPYFNYFGFNRLTSRFIRGQHNSVLEFTDSDDFIKFRKSTKFGSSIEGTDYGDFALQGKFMLDDTTNVSKMPDNQFKQQFNVVLYDNCISCGLVNNILYLKRNRDMMSTMFTPFVEDAKKYGAIFCNKNLNHFDLIIKKLMADEIMYESLEIKNAVIEFAQWKMGNTYR